jgi:hypothetical protein
MLIISISTEIWTIYKKVFLLFFVLLILLDNFLCICARSYLRILYVYRNDIGVILIV